MQRTVHGGLSEDVCCACQQVPAEGSLANEALRWWTLMSRAEGESSGSGGGGGGNAATAATVVLALAAVALQQQRALSE
jgi:hypothetical protein